MLHHPIICYKIHILKIPLLNYMFHMFLIFMSIFMLIGCHLPFDLKTQLMHYVILQKLGFKQLIDNIAINLWSLWNFASIKNIWK